MALITPANAAEMSAKGHAAKAKLLEDLRQAANPVPPATDNSYIQRSLLRVREQIEQVNKRMDEALTADVLDAGAIDRLANALTRLREMERVMDGRALPGSKRPSSKPDKVKPSFEPASE